MRILCVIIFLFVRMEFSSAQLIAKYEQPIHQPVFLYSPSDTTTLRYLNEDSLAAAQLSPVDTSIRERKSATIAMLSSMIVPGMGQIYNESYWKAPLFWGLSYYYISIYVGQDKLYKEYQFRYDTTITAARPVGNLDEKDIRDFYHRQRDEFAWYFVMMYVLNIVDAYVDASLYNFEVSPNLQGTTSYRASVRIPILSPTKNP
jgi:hypothetical protein